MADRTDEALRAMWRSLRDDGSAEAVMRFRGAVAFAESVRLLTPDLAELWIRRAETCPGHDDEGGRNWCAFCGTMPREDENG